jgi:hypothetical protein
MASFVGSNELKEKIACKNITTCNNKKELLCSTFKGNKRKKTKKEGETYPPTMGIVAQENRN